MFNCILWDGVGAARGAVARGWEIGVGASAGGMQVAAVKLFMVSYWRKSGRSFQYLIEQPDQLQSARLQRDVEHECGSAGVDHPQKHGHHDDCKVSVATK